MAAVGNDHSGDFLVALTRQIVTIAYIDGRVVTYPITPKIQLTFERTHKVGITKLNDGQEGATNVYRLAHFVQSQNLTGYPANFPIDVEQWLDDVDAVEVNDEAVVPFDAAARNGGSANSPSLQELATVN